MRVTPLAPSLTLTGWDAHAHLSCSLCRPDPVRGPNGKYGVAVPHFLSFLIHAARRRVTTVINYNFEVKELTPESSRLAALFIERCIRSSERRVGSLSSKAAVVGYLVDHARAK